MPRFVTETTYTGDQTWLGSTHGIYNARTGSVDVSTFTAGTHFPNGYLLSGLPLGRITATDTWVLYNSAGSGGAQNLEGFLLTTQKVASPTEKLNAPVLQHGIVNVDRLPIALTVPSTAKQFVFVGAGV